jgi:hypothetical protein
VSPSNRFVSKEKPSDGTKPVATNDTPEGRAMSRRVTFEVIKQNNQSINSVIKFISNSRMDFLPVIL